MKTFGSLFRRLILLAEYIAVLVFLVFEELVWERIARPLYRYIHGLKLLRALEERLSRANRYVVLALFLLPFVGVELAGVAAGVLIVSGHLIGGLLLYGLKIPIAAMVFWLFNVTRTQLFTFPWLHAAYRRLTEVLAWIKNREVYRAAVEMLRRIKGLIRQQYGRIRSRLFSGRSRWRAGLSRIYRMLKKRLFGRFRS